MSYPKDLLATRSIVKPGLFAVITKGGLVNNVIPYIKNCRVSIVASPKMGASFVQYVVIAQPNGYCDGRFAAGTQEEGFIYLMSGRLKVCCDGKEYFFSDGDYLYAPAGVGFTFENIGASEARLLLYKQVYVPLEDAKPYVYTGNTNKIEYRVYEEMENVFIKDLLPTELGFDMNMHILAFAPGGCHPIVETHVQEHGAYVLSGEGMYLLDDQWMGIKKDDFIWFGPYVAQAAYGVGRELFAYIYSKDCNRDVVL